jgi:hypothetical protein
LGVSLMVWVWVWVWWIRTEAAHTRGVENMEQ